MRTPDFLDRQEDDDEPEYNAENVECKHCGEDGLTWHHTGVRWRLMDEDGKLHVCKPSADGFEVLKSC